MSRGYSSYIPNKDFKVAPRCYTTHPSLALGKGILYGGSCIQPKVEDCDVYVGLDFGMTYTDRSLPWTDGVEFPFLISDMAAPSNSSKFFLLIEYLCNQLQIGKRVHVGCIGGHGRTGTVIAAVMKMFVDRRNSGNVDYDWVDKLPDQPLILVADVISWVRKHYCEKAVESKEQIEFLNKWWKIKKVKPSKVWVENAHTGNPVGLDFYEYSAKEKQFTKDLLENLDKKPTYSKKTSIIRPAESNKNVWRFPS